MKAAFGWDPVKAVSNLRKHGVSVETATRVFLDPNALIEEDRVDGGEQRWLAIGMVEGLVLLTVAHTVRERDGSETIRIISARKADRKERSNYEKANG